ncbi:MAG: universal stress protein [Chitinophagaceae bacterium]|nr:universal stress protein [Chitinophagaceae bacterium]
MKTLIVPTDFSPVSLNAMNYAAEMAKSLEASMLLVHIFQVPVTFTEVPVAAVPVEEMRSSSEAKLNEMKKAAEHITSGAVKVYTEARMGDTIEELKDLCEAIQPLAIVMGTHGNSGLERLIMGSTTLTAIKHLTWPVIAIPPGTVFKNIKKIGLACDFRDVVNSTPVTDIKKIVKEMNADLHILNVDYNQQRFNQNTPLESAYLETMLEDVSPQYHFINKPDVVEGINEFADSNNLDLLMVVPKKHKLLESIFHKSSSAGLITHSHIPVLSIHE